MPCERDVMSLLCLSAAMLLSTSVIIHIMADHHPDNKLQEAAHGKQDDSLHLSLLPTIRNFTQKTSFSFCIENDSEIYQLKLLELCLKS
ncbi:hypothetical protein GOP47_0001497 [Adiantum capillus-veneris]|uniref:Uncharacterized protein n=1 Tax=Adiantum capillus-veneris TaxID=13818 RepID=A0A9D4V924_ADICA|nr:hypothetical protein GOP47_0001497 [Adiantum capillus-veneris]